MKDIDLILTADRSIMNNFHLKWRFCIPTWTSTDIVPQRMFNMVVRKPTHKDGIPKFAPLSLRKIEASLLDQGYNSKIVIPEYIQKYLKKSMAVGITSIDPTGSAFGPLYLHMFCDEKASQVQFERVLGSKKVQEARKDGLKTIVGGTGAWQFKKVPKEVDCLVGGESERILPYLLDKIKAKKKLPRRINCHGKFIPDPDEIKPIMKPSQFGLIQIGRGCPRRCKFCSVSGKPHWFSLDYIESEIKVNVNAGLKHTQLLSGDLLLYGSNNLIPDERKFFKMMSLVSKYNKFVSLSHFSVSAINNKPQLFQQIDKHLPKDQDFIIAQTGFETASDHLLKEIAPAKKAPFKDISWKDMLLKTVDIVEDSIVFPYYTILLGCPQSDEKDICQTLNLIEEISDHKSIIMPCLYTIPGDPHKEVDDLMDLEKDLIRKCFDHNLSCYRDLSDKIIKMYSGKGRIVKFVRDFVYHSFKKRLRKRFDNLYDST